LLALRCWYVMAAQQPVAWLPSLSALHGRMPVSGLLAGFRAVL